MTLLERDMQDLQDLHMQEYDILKKTEQLKKDIVFLHCPVKIGDVIESNMGTFDTVEFKVEAVWLEHRFRRGGYFFRAWGYVVGKDEPNRQAFWYGEPLSTEENSV